MRVNRQRELAQSVVDAEGAKDVTMRMLVGPEDGCDAIHMRLFTVRPGGHTPLHDHPWEHLVKVERGRGIAVDAAGEEHPLEPGSSVFVEPSEIHQFRNPHQEDFEFVCVIPNPKTRE